jgi:hypothetical protein
MFNLHNKFVFFLAACAAFPVHARQPLHLSDGSVVADCAMFEKKRQIVSVAENPRDAVTAADYLDCTLSWGGDNPGSADKLKPIVDALRASSFPSSLGPRASGTQTFVDLGARFDTGSKALVFEEEGQHLKLRFIQRKGPEFLVWVDDEIPEAGYRAYFPVLLHWDGTVVTAKPFYAGGY